MGYPHVGMSRGVGRGAIVAGLAAGLVGSGSTTAPTGPPPFDAGATYDFGTSASVGSDIFDGGTSASVGSDIFDGGDSTT